MYQMDLHIITADADMEAEHRYNLSQIRMYVSAKDRMAVTSDISQ